MPWKFTVDDAPTWEAGAGATVSPGGAGSGPPLDSAKTVPPATIRIKGAASRSPRASLLYLRSLFTVPISCPYCPNPLPEVDPKN